MLLLCVITLNHRLSLKGHSLLSYGVSKQQFHLWGECSTTACAERFALVYRRMENSFITQLLRTYFCTRNALNRKAEVQKSACKAYAPECEFVVCLFKCIQVLFPFWQQFSFPLALAKVLLQPAESQPLRSHSSCSCVSLVFISPFLLSCK